MNSDLVPESLRRTIANDLQPVRPLPPAWMRTLEAATVAALGLAAVVTVFHLKLRPDMGELPMWLGWGCTILQLGIGVLLVSMALRESVPGRGIPQRTAAIAIGAGVLMQIVVGIATWMHSPGMPLEAGEFMPTGMSCARHDTSMALPALAVTLFLVFRALPLRPSMAGLLGGAGAAVTADAMTHILCPMSDLRHVLAWHTGALLGLMAIGWLTGKIWEKLRYRKA